MGTKTMNALQAEIKALKEENKRLSNVVRLNQRNKEEDSFTGLNKILSSLGTDSTENIHILVEQTHKLFQTVCSLYNRLDEEKKSLITWSQFNAPPDLEKEDNPEGHICYEATIRGRDKIIVLEDLKGTVYEQSDANVKKYKLRSYLGAPIRVGRETIGSLCVVDVRPRKFTPKEIENIKILSKILSLEEERRRAEEKLVQSEKFYHTLFDSSPGGILLEDDTGTILNVNPAFCKLMGYKAKELIGHKVHVLASPDRLQNVDANIKRLLSGETLRFVEESVRKDGSHCFMQLNEQRIILPDGSPGILSIVQDMSEQVMANRALQESDQRYRTLFEYAPYPIVVHSKGKIVALNNAAVSFSEVKDRSELLGKSVMSFVHPDYRALAGQRIQKLTEEGNALSFIEEKFITAKENIRDVEVGVVPFVFEGEPAAQVVFRDITERKINEQRILESEERYRTLVKALPIPILVHSEGIVKFINLAAVKAFGGTSAERLLNAPVLDYIHPAFRTQVKERIKQIYNSDVGLPLNRQKLLKTNGEAFDVELMAIHTVFEGKPASLVTFLDISERVKWEETLKESELKFRTIVENSHAGIVIIDSGFHFTYVNPQFCELTGYRAEKLVNQDFRLVLDEESKKLVADRYRRRQQGEEVPSQYKFNILRKDNTIRRVEIRSSVVANWEQKAVTIAQVLDITESEKAEKALRDSEEKYRALAETASDFILIHDFKGVIKYANHAAMEGSGYGSKLVGKNIVRILPRNRMAEMRERYEQRLKNDVFRFLFETEIIVKNGAFLPLEVSSSLLDSQGESAGILLVARDISKRKAAEEALRQSEQKFKQLVDNSLTGIYITQQHILKFCNKKFVDIFGFDSVDELLGMHIQQLVEPASWALVDSEVQKRESGEKEASRYEFKCVRKDGSVFDAEVLGGRIQYQGKSAIQGTMIDISSRKKAEEQISRLATVVEQAAETILITDVDGIIQYVNPAFTYDTGYRKEEALGKKPNILSSGKHDDAFFKDLWDTIIAGNKWNSVIINKKKNNELYHERAAIFPIKDENGKNINYAAILRDITVEKKLEAQLQQAQKMEAIGTLSGGIAHDFNNLLTVINGHAEIALLHTNKEMRAHGDLLSILKAGKRAEKLTNQLLAFSRKQIHELKIIAMNSVIRDLDKMLRRLIAADIQIEYDLADELPYIEADPGQIEQILINLIINARDAINENSDRRAEKKILIQTQLRDLDDLFVQENSESRPGAYIRMCVQDSGKGMDEEVKNRIFEPFFTTKEVGKGTGLGLATVYGIVKQNNGYIDVESQPGEGTMFAVYWPVTKRKPAPELIRKFNRNNLSGSEHILLVEDDDDVRNFSADALQNFGYKITEARSGKSALELIKKRKEPFDLIITDLIMPEMNGSDLVDALRKRIPQCKVLFVSGYTYDHLQNNGALKENINFLQKPYSIQNLLEMIRNIMDREVSSR